uniref:Kinesin motor domain-containing protein n=1 Tax=Macrostomum lignano TaxID=282301 RepID=A0A1I8FL50_9PLAT
AERGQRRRSLCKKVNDSLNNPPQPGSRSGWRRRRAASAGGIGGAGGGSGSLSSALSGLGESELSMPSRVQSSPGVRPAGSAPIPRLRAPDRQCRRRPATAGRLRRWSRRRHGGGRASFNRRHCQQQQRHSRRRIQLSDLQTILTSIQAPAKAPLRLRLGSAGAQFDLNDALPIESLLPLLADAPAAGPSDAFPARQSGSARSVDELRRSVQIAAISPVRVGVRRPLCAPASWDRWLPSSASARPPFKRLTKATPRRLCAPAAAEATAAAAAAEGSEDVEMAASLPSLTPRMRGENGRELN